MSQQRAKELLKKLESEGKVIPGTYDKTFKYVMTNCKDYLASILTNFIDMDKEEIKKMPHTFCVGHSLLYICAIQAKAHSNGIIHHAHLCFVQMPHMLP